MAGEGTVVDLTEELGVRDLDDYLQTVVVPAYRLAR